MKYYNKYSPKSTTPIAMVTQLDAQQFTDTVCDFWEERLSPEQRSQFADYLRTFHDKNIFDGISDDDLIKSVHHNFVDGTDLEIEFTPIILRKIKELTIQSPSPLYTVDFVNKSFGESKVLFSGCAPLDHPFPGVFAGMRSHVVELLAMDDGFIFENVYLGENMRGSESPEIKVKNAAMWMAAKTSGDIQIWINGENKGPPPAATVDVARGILEIME